VANYGGSPGQLTVGWLRSAAKWFLGTMLESGTLRWTTVSQERLPSLRRFDKWLTACLDDPRQVLGDPATARQQAAHTPAGRPTHATGWPASAIRGTSASPCVPA